MRHLAVRREGGGPHTLLTAFARELRITSPSNGVFVREGETRTVLLVGPRKHQDVETDAHFAVVCRAASGERVEVYRFGGSFVRVGKLRIEGPSRDHFAVVENGQVVRAVSTLP